MSHEAYWSRDGKTQDSGSAVSGLTSQEDDTDEFGRMIAQHARDEQRLELVLNGNGNGQPFRKARTRIGVGNNMDIGHDLGDSDRHSLSSGTSDPGTWEHTYSNGADPPLNVPREWGRKARHGSSWLRRLADRDFEPERPASANGLDERAHGVSPNGATGIDWAEAANMAVQSVEQQTPLSTKSPNFAAPFARAQRENRSIDRIRQWEVDQDFTAGSILESTPAVGVRRYNNAAAGRLSRISERSPYTDKDELESRLTRLAAQPLVRREHPTPDDRRWGGSRANKDKENVVPQSGIAEQRQSSSRADSMDMLKRLARVTSQSPSSVTNEAKVMNGHSRSVNASNESRALRHSSAQAPEVVSQDTRRSPVESTPQVSTRLIAKTPKVIGGWVETPFTTRHDSVQPSLFKEEARGAMRDNAPSIAVVPAELPQETRREPRSALSALLHPTRLNTASHEPASLSPVADLKLGDDTMRSLESLLNGPTTADNTADLSNTLQLDDVKAELAALHSRGRPLSKADEERRDELLAIEGMNERLRAARRGVREVGKGLRDVERAVEAAAGTTSPSTPRCTTCAASPWSKGVWRAAGREALSMFVREETPGNTAAVPSWLPLAGGSSSGSRLTLLGLATLALASWLALERAACAAYCQPAAAPSMAGFGVDPDAPRFPFVIPTVLARPLRWLWRPLLGALAWLLSGLWSAVIAYLSIPFEDDATASGAAAAATPNDLTGPLLPPSKSSWLWAGSRPVLQARDRTTLRTLRDRRARKGRRAGAYETMDDDKVVGHAAKASDESCGKIGPFRLWSCDDSPVVAATSARTVVSSTSTALEQTSGAAAWDEYDWDKAGYGDWQRDREASDTPVDGPIWETGDGMGMDELVL